jgi:hypothetical protein
MGTRTRNTTGAFARSDVTLLLCHDRRDQTPHLHPHARSHLPVAGELRAAILQPAAPHGIPHQSQHGSSARAQAQGEPAGSTRDWKAVDPSRNHGLSMSATLGGG